MNRPRFNLAEAFIWTFYLALFFALFGRVLPPAVTCIAVAWLSAIALLQRFSRSENAAAFAVVTGVLLVILDGILIEASMSSTVNPPVRIRIDGILTIGVVFGSGGGFIAWVEVYLLTKFAVKASGGDKHTTSHPPAGR